MLINTNLPVPADASNADLRPRGAAATSPGVANSGTDAAESAQERESAAARMQGLSQPDGEIQDGSAADQAQQSLRSSMFSQPGMIFAAQANLNPQTVYNLLQ